MLSMSSLEEQNGLIIRDKMATRFLEPVRKNIQVVRRVTELSTHTQDHPKRIVEGRETNSTRKRYAHQIVIFNIPLISFKVDNTIIPNAKITFSEEEAVVIHLHNDVLMVILFNVENEKSRES